MPGPGNIIFVNYRRVDTFPYALALKSEIESRLRSVQVFVDLKRLRIGQDWPEAVLASVKSARVVLALIGPEWRVANPATGKPRFHDADDWVRQELATALATGSAVVLPILIAGAAAPNPDELPDDLKRLAGINAAQLKAKYWSQGVEEIVSALADGLAFERRPDQFTDPKGGGKKGESLLGSRAQVEQVLSQPGLEGWRISDEAAGDGRREEWLVKTFQFPSFIDAMQFMARVADHCNVVDHHPRWENQYDQLRVRLSTFDVGRKLTAHDMALAEHMNRVAREYDGRTRA